MTQEEIENKTRDYFDAFSRKDASALSKMFHRDILLRDWNISVNGLESVINANKEIFQSCEQLKVEIEKIYTSGMVSISKIEILVDEDRLLVTDFLEFDQQGKIVSVTAYRGN